MVVGEANDQRMGVQRLGDISEDLVVSAVIDVGNAAA